MNRTINITKELVRDTRKKMTGLDMIVSRYETSDIKTELENAGWGRGHTVMHSGKDNNFGTLFYKEMDGVDIDFYFNYLTIDAIKETILNK